MIVQEVHDLYMHGSKAYQQQHQRLYETEMPRIADRLRAMLNIVVTTQTTPRA